MIFNMVSAGGGTTIVQVPTVSVGTYTYNGSAQGPTITGLDTDKTIVTNATATNAGTYTLTIALKNTAKMVWSDMTTADKTYSYTIAKADITGATVSISGYTYAGTKSTPTISGNTSGGAVTYYGRASASGTATLWDSVTSTTYDAGTRYCYAVIAETANYNSFTTANASFTIAKADFTGATVSISGYTYAGTKSTPTISGNVSGGTVTYYGRATASGSATAWTSVTSTTYDAGTRYCYAVIAATTNYNSYTTANASFTIAKASFTASVSISGYAYAGTKSTPTVSSNPGSGAVTYYGRASASGTATAWSSVTSTTYNAGTRYCYAVIAETTNYNGYTTGNTSFTISQATPSFSLSKTSMTLNSSTTSDTSTLTYNGDGTVTVSSSDSSVATASKSGSTITVSSVDNTTGTATITVSAAAGTNYVAASGTISVTCQFVTIYGAEWNGTSTTAWTRTDAAANFTDPVPYVSGASSYSSPFDNLMPWSGMTKSTRTGGVMVAIPKFYYKLTQSGTKVKVQIADGYVEGYSVSPAHLKRGSETADRDVVYIGRYHCGSSDYKSTTGVSPKANVTRSTARTGIHNLGTKIWQCDFAMRFTLWLLYIVEFADWNSQAKIGYGCGNNSSAGTMGYTDSMPYHTGTTQSSRTTYGLGTQYRNIEGLWDNVLDWMDGCYYNSSGMNIILNPSSFSNSSGGTLMGKPSSGYPSAFTVSSSGGFPAFYASTASGGSTTTYSCDNWDFNASYPCLYVGGSYYRGLYYGLFYVYGDSASYANAYVGCRLQELP